MKAVCMTNVLVTEMVLYMTRLMLSIWTPLRISGLSYNIYWAFPQLTQAGGEIKKKNTIRVKINKK